MIGLHRGKYAEKEVAVVLIKASRYREKER